MFIDAYNQRFTTNDLQPTKKSRAESGILGIFQYFRMRDLKIRIFENIVAQIFLLSNGQNETSLLANL